LTLFILNVCSAQGARQAGEEPKEAQSGLETRVLRIGAVTLEAELARTERERETGLMYRTELPDGRGMLFIFEGDEVLSFWMKNTLIPLSVAFIDYEGKILEIKDLEPRDLRSVHSSRSVRYALEVPQGWFSRAGVQAGDRIDLSGL
jgi:uncharacterized membrane protein (UPF0127 family)